MKLRFAIGTISTGGKNEIRIYIKSPFDRELSQFLGKAAIVLILLPETEEEEKVLETLRKLRLQLES